MSEDQYKFMTIHRQLPARVTAEEAGWLLNCPIHSIPILMARRLLKPLGNPAPNSIKYFSTEEILVLTKERSWLNKMTNAINEHWRNKNLRKSNAIESMSVEKSVE